MQHRHWHPLSSSGKRLLNWRMGKRLVLTQAFRRLGKSYRAQKKGLPSSFARKIAIIERYVAIIEKNADIMRPILRRQGDTKTIETQVFSSCPTSLLCRTEHSGSGRLLHVLRRWDALMCVYERIAHVGKPNIQVLAKRRIHHEYKVCVRFIQRLLAMPDALPSSKQEKKNETFSM